MKRRLEKLGIASLIPRHHGMGDRPAALQEGLTIVRNQNLHQYASYETPDEITSLPDLTGI